MESFAYLQLALASELPTEPVFFEGLNWKKLSSQIYIRLLSLAAILGVLAIASSTLALQRGERNQAVVRLQQRLQALNYFNAGITGYYGTATETAVRSFQRNQGLTVDGIAGSRTLAALGLATPSQNFTPFPVIPMSNNPTPTISEVCKGLRFGDRGPSVDLLQRQLKDLGYFQGGVDGKFRERTLYAVIRFQQENGLPSDGCADTATLTSIDFNMRQLPSSSSVGTRPITLPATVGGNSLQFGDTGREVEAIQQRLKDLGYFNANITGYFGEVTQEAVIRFQQDRQLPTTGVVDRQTLAALQNSSGGAIALPNFSGNSYATLRRGDRGDRVTQLQLRLRVAGYNPGSIDGVFAGKTEYAVLRFQQDRGLPANGIATSNTLSLLYGGRSSDFVTTSAVPLGTIPATTASNLNTRLSVLELQRRLRAQGLYSGPLNGDFNPQTRTAITQAQIRYGLSAEDILAGAF